MDLPAALFSSVKRSVLVLLLFDHIVKIWYRFYMQRTW